MRQWAILRLLADSGRSFTVKELADQLGASKPTIQRDLATLERDFNLIEEQVGAQKKAYRIEKRIRALESVDFTIMELLALHAALAGLHGLPGTPLHGDLTSVTRKLRGFLSPRHNGGLDAMARVFAPHPRGHVDSPLDDELVDGLVDAIARRRRCHVTYFAAWKKTTRTHRIRPLRLVWHRSALYLFALIDGKRDITTLAVHRIRALEVTGDEFSAPRADVEGHIRRAFGIFVSDAEQDVEILFSPEIAWRVAERRYHPDERKTTLPDGSLRYELRSSAQWEIVPWVLSFGPLATLVRPEPWRQALADALRDALPRYTDAD